MTTPNIYKSSLLILFNILLIHFSWAQERLGIITSNYAGSNSTMINPALIVKPPMKLDINIFTIGTFMDNNYVYVPSTNFFDLIKRLKKSTPMIYNEKNVIWEERSSDFIVKDVYDKKNKIAYMNLILRGPSFMLRIKKQSFGFHTAIRQAMSLRNVPFALAKFGFEGVGYKPQHDRWWIAPDFRFTTLSWSELGFSYGRVLSENTDRDITGGITLKKLSGYLSGFLLSEKFKYKIEMDSIQPFTFKYVQKSTATYGYTDPFSFKAGNLKKGGGIGLDVGINYIKKNKKYNYRWKLGASIIDIGKINFKNNSQQLRVEEGDAFFHRLDSVIFNSMTDLDTFVSQKFYQDYLATQDGQQFKVVLPTAFSTQFDYNFFNGFFLNVLWVQRIHSFEPRYSKTPGVDRENLIALTPRFEKKYFEIHFPMVLYDYRYPRVGLAIRWAYLIVGTDKFSSLFLKKRFFGYDLYVTLKFFMNEKKRKRKRSGNLSSPFYSRGSTKGMPCFEFNKK